VIEKEGVVRRIADRPLPWLLLEVDGEEEINGKLASWQQSIAESSRSQLQKNLLTDLVAGYQRAVNEHYHPTFISGVTRRLTGHNKTAEKKALIADANAKAQRFARPMGDCTAVLEMVQSLAMPRTNLRVSLAMPLSVNIAYTQLEEQLRRVALTYPLMALGLLLVKNLSFGYVPAPDVFLPAMLLGMALFGLSCCRAQMARVPQVVDAVVAMQPQIEQLAGQALRLSAVAARFSVHITARGLAQLEAQAPARPPQEAPDRRLTRSPTERHNLAGMAR
jgi:hypothetical protein